jgi:hypothetical protein
LKGKNLTDDGFVEVINSLRDAVVLWDSVPAFRLEELDLTHNGLTTTSLRRLVPLIEDCCYDIKHINLSNNSIRVETQQERDDWEAFLESFRQCRRMRRLDVSGNDLSKSLALEIFLRVYCRHRWVDPVNPEIYSDTSYMMKGGITEMTSSLYISDSDGALCRLSPDASLTSLSNGRILEARDGLRSIPYLLLTNGSIEDPGVLHLSYVLAEHYSPRYLMPELKRGSCEAQQQMEDDSTPCFGVVYVQNDRISSFAEKLLEKAEAARRELPGVLEKLESTSNSDANMFEGMISTM